MENNSGASSSSFRVTGPDGQTVSEYKAEWDFNREVPVNGIEAMISDVMLRSGRFRVVERAALDNVLSEQDLVTSGRVAKPSGAKTGQVLGAEYLVQAVITSYEPDYKGKKVLVIGSGATAATLMADSGLRVVVLEKATFPRFHIGESLLPATVRIFDRLGVHDSIREHFVQKPGGKWLYGDDEVPGDFSNFDEQIQGRNQDAPNSRYETERAGYQRQLLHRISLYRGQVTPANRLYL